MTFAQTLADLLLSPMTLNSMLALAALMALNADHDPSPDDNDDDDLDDDYSDLEDEPDFTFSQNDIKELKKQFAEINERIDAINSSLARETDAEKRQNLELELIRYYLTKAALEVEFEEDLEEQGLQDYQTLLEKIAAFEKLYGDESRDFLKQKALAYLNYGILLYDRGDFQGADQNYIVAGLTNDKLASFGDEEAALDAVGVTLNRATLLFELGNHEQAYEMLDAAIVEFQKVASSDSRFRNEASYYLAKTYMTKCDYLRGQDDNAPEANEAAQNASAVYRSLIESGNTQYKRDYADALLTFVLTASEEQKNELDELLEALNQARQAYETVIAHGETDACVDLFDVFATRGDLLFNAQQNDEALNTYNALLESFSILKSTDELPILEGLAVAMHRRAQLRKETAKTQELLKDLEEATTLQLRISEELMETLEEKHDHDHCCHTHDEGREHKHECCGHGCGHDHDAEEHGGCQCGCDGCGELGPAARKFFVERWAQENYDEIMQLFYWRAQLYLENGNHDAAREAVATALAVRRAYQRVLKDGETLQSDRDPLLDALANAF